MTVARLKINSDETNSNFWIMSNPNRTFQQQKYTFLLCTFKIFMGKNYENKSISVHLWTIFRLHL